MPSAIIAIYTTIRTITEIKAPFPAIFEFFGRESFQTRKRISPTTGKQKPRRPHPKLPVSSEATIVCCCTPHFGHITALSSIAWPQFLQYAINASIIIYSCKKKKEFPWTFLASPKKSGTYTSILPENCNRCDRKIMALCVSIFCSQDKNQSTI